MVRDGKCLLLSGRWRFQHGGRKRGPCRTQCTRSPDLVRKHDVAFVPPDPMKTVSPGGLPERQWQPMRVIASSRRRPALARHMRAILVDPNDSRQCRGITCANYDRTLDALQADYSRNHHRAAKSPWRYGDDRKVLVSRLPEVAYVPERYEASTEQHTKSLRALYSQMRFRERELEEQHISKTLDCKRVSGSMDFRRVPVRERCLMNEGRGWSPAAIKNVQIQIIQAELGTAQFIDAPNRRDCAGY